MFFFVCSATLFYLQSSSFLFAAFLFYICSGSLFCFQRSLFLFAAFLFCLQRFFFVCSVPFLFAAFLFCMQRIFFVCSGAFYLQCVPCGPPYKVDRATSTIQKNLSIVLTFAHVNFRFGSCSTHRQLWVT